MHDLRFTSKKFGNDNKNFKERVDFFKKVSRSFILALY